jgi:hypothetical protein
MTENSVPSHLLNATAEGIGWQASPGRFLIKGSPRVGRFLIEDGERITLQRNPTVQDDILCVHFLSSVIVVLLRQRGNQVLHASVIDTPRGSIALSGGSGAGKTTTQAALLTLGCRMVADDVSVLRLNKNSQIEVLPGIFKMNLCDDAAIKLGHDINALQRNPLRKGKVFVKVDQNAVVTVPVILKAIYLLSLHSGEDLIITPVLGAEKIVFLHDCIYGPQLCEEHPQMFPITSALAENVEMLRLERPAHKCSVNKVAEAILHG